MLDNLLHRRHRTKPPVVTDVHDVLTIDQEQLLELDATFAPPRWLRDLGRSSWFLVGVFAVIGATMWLLAETYTIVGPVVAAMIVATVAMPVVSVLSRHMPRAVAAAIVLLSLAAVAVVIAIMVVAGISGQIDALAQNADKAAARAQSWLESLGVERSSASGA
jgi:predicted PurR-regulated permease PerM